MIADLIELLGGMIQLIEVWRLAFGAMAGLVTAVFVVLHFEPVLLGWGVAIVVTAVGIGGGFHWQRAADARAASD